MFLRTEQMHYSCGSSSSMRQEASSMAGLVHELGSTTINSRFIKVVIRHVVGKCIQQKATLTWVTFSPCVSYFCVSHVKRERTYKPVATTTVTNKQQSQQRQVLGVSIVTAPWERSVSVRLHHLEEAAVLAVSTFFMQFADTQQPAAAFDH